MIPGKSPRLADLSAELRALVQEHGPSLLGQPNLLDSLLKDTHPKRVQEALLLRAAAQLIGPLFNANVSPRELDLMARKLSREGYLRVEGARWAVQMLAQSLDLVTPSSWSSDDDDEELAGLGRGRLIAIVGATLFCMATLSFYVGYRSGAGKVGHVAVAAPPLTQGDPNGPLFAAPQLQAVDPNTPDSVPPLVAHKSHATEPTSVDDDAHEGPPKRILITRNAPVRPAPSPEAGPVMCTLMAGDRVTVLDVMRDETGSSKRKYRWYQVPCDLKRSGWVSRNFVAGE